MKKKRGILNILSILILVVGTAGCSSKHYDWRGGLINNFGEYYLKKNAHVLKVTNNGGLLHYVLEDGNHKIVLQSLENISIYQHWAMFWDENDNLWIKSSDIGAFLWTCDRDGKYERMILTPGNDKFKAMPPGLK